MRYHSNTIYTVAPKLNDTTLHFELQQMNESIQNFMTFGTHKLHKSTNKNGVLLTLELYVNSYSLEGPTES